MRLPLPLSLLLSTLLLAFPFMHDASAATPSKKKFENPARKFEGTWRVESHDFREFVAAPADLASQFQNEAGAFPVGQRLRFTYTGSAALPGGIDPVSMRSTGPVGETLRMTLLAPFASQMCESKVWSQVCKGREQHDYSDEVMIDEIVNWTRDIPKEYAEVWSELLPLQYSLLHLGKSYHVGARFAKDGDLYIMVTIDGRAKGRGKAPDSDAKADVGIHLKRVDK